MTDQGEVGPGRSGVEQEGEMKRGFLCSTSRLQQQPVVESKITEKAFAHHGDSLKKSRPGLRLLTVHSHREAVVHPVKDRSDPEELRGRP